MCRTMLMRSPRLSARSWTAPSRRVVQPLGGAPSPAMGADRDTATPAADYEWSCQVCDLANPPGASGCAACGAPAVISSLETEGRRRARDLGEQYAPSKHDRPPPAPTHSVWESVSLGRHAVARRIGGSVWAGSLIFAPAWLVLSLAMEISWRDRLTNVALLLLSASIVRAFCTGRTVYVRWRSVPGVPGRTGLRWSAGLTSLVFVVWIVGHMIQAVV